ncbi:MAG: sugar phosphate isomerase/epimerase family protein [Acidobacteriaceae bacterium]
MTLLNRRSFVQLASAACISSGIRPAPAQSLPRVPVPGAVPMQLGLVLWIRNGESIDAAVKSVHDLGLPTCQIGFNQLSSDVATPVKNALTKYGVEATALSEHGPGVRIFNFYQGPETIGIIPPATREARIHNLKLASDVASQCGVPAVHTHCGFIPENPNDPLYPQAVAAVKDIGGYCKERGQIFLCEAGQETPITLLRLIEDVGLDNVFVNLDLANLIMYGKGNPVDAMDVIGHRVRGIHAKDGLFPTNPKDLGIEVAMGKGKVDFPVVLQQLKQVGYKGAMTIECEIPGDQRKADILGSKAFLERLLAKTYS